MRALSLRHLGFLVLLWPASAISAQGHAPAAAPPGGAASGRDAAPPSTAASGGDATVTVDGRTGAVTVPPEVTSQSDVLVRIVSPGEKSYRYRVEAKSEDEPDPRRFEVATLSGGPVGGGAPGARVPPSEHPIPPGKSPACDEFATYLGSASAAGVAPDAALDLAAACDVLRGADGRLDHVRGHLAPILARVDKPDEHPEDAGAEDLAQALDQTVSPGQGLFDAAVKRYRLLLREARIVKAEVATRPADLRSTVVTALKALVKPAAPDAKDGDAKGGKDAKAVKPGAGARDKPRPVPPELVRLASAVEREAASSDEAWRRILDLEVSTAMADLQHLLSAVAQARDRVAGEGTVDRRLGRFPPGKRVTVTVYRSSSLALDAPPVDGAQAAAPQAETVLTTGTFHVYHRVSLALSIGAGVAFPFNRSQDFGIGQNAGGTKFVQLTRDDTVVPDLFLLLSWNPFSRCQGESAPITGPWLTAGASLSSPLKSWIPVGLSVEFAHAVMLTGGFYLARRNVLDPSVSAGATVDASVSAAPVATRWNSGLVFVLSFDPPVLKSLISK